MYKETVHKSISSSWLYNPTWRHVDSTRGKTGMTRIEADTKGMLPSFTFHHPTILYMFRALVGA